MQVTFLTGEYPPMQGGIADHTAHLARYLAPLGVESTVLISRRWGNTGLPIPPTPPVQPLVPNWSWRCWPAVAKYLARRQPHVLHIQYQAAAFDLGGWVNWLPWYLGRRRRGNSKIVTTFHDLRIPYIFPKAGPLRWQAVLALARHSDAVICTNREDMERLSGALGHRRSPIITLIPLGSNVEPQPPVNFNRADLRAKFGANDQTLLLAYFGFLNESKGGEELVEALAALRRQGVNARLLLIGGEVGHADPTNAAYARRVQSLIERLELTGAVQRTGYVDLPQVSACLLAADAVVMPYRDGVSFRRTTLIAALRHGCPVVSTWPANPNVIPEIQPGDNMLLAPPRNAAALAQTIAPLATDATLRGELSRGAKTLGQLFDWSEIAGQTASLYQTVTRRVF